MEGFTVIYCSLKTMWRERRGLVSTCTSCPRRLLSQSMRWIDRRSTTRVRDPPTWTYRRFRLTTNLHLLPTRGPGLDIFQFDCLIKPEARTMDFGVSSRAARNRTEAMESNTEGFFARKIVLYFSPKQLFPSLYECKCNFESYMCASCSVFIA